MRNKNNICRWMILAAVLMSCSIASAQVQIEMKPNEKSAEKKSGDRWQIPEASLPCSPEVKAWWDSLREAADKVRRSRGDKKDRKNFAELLEEGATKSYKPPIADHKPFSLVQVQPQFTEEGRRHKINGYIILRVEFRADGTVGEVKPLNSLGFGLDQSAVEAALKIVFLPAVQNGVFVNFTTRVEMTFHVY